MTIVEGIIYSEIGIVSQIICTFAAPFREGMAFLSLILYTK